MDGRRTSRGLHTTAILALAAGLTAGATVASIAPAAAIGLAGVKPVLPGGALLLHRVQADSKQARRLVIAGVKAFERQSHEEAVKNFSAALNTGGIASKDMAKAMFYRGQAYQNSKRPAQAIADYTSAMWISNGLSTDERVRALKLREAAYKSAGIAPAQDELAKRILAEAERKGQSGTASGTAVSVPSLTNPLSGIGSVFSGLFGGGSSSKPAPPAATAATTSPQRPVVRPPVTAARAAVRPAAAPSKPTAAVSAWNSTTQTKPSAAPNQVAPRVAPPPTRRATVAPGSRRAAPMQKATRPAAPVRTAALPKPSQRGAGTSLSQRAPQASGRFKVQVAAVRSRGEAERLARRLQRNYGALLGARRPSIRETVYGNMGTFYRVEVGPFQRQAQTDTLCASLKAAGYDCLVSK